MSRDYTHGATPGINGGTRFRLWAPDADNVAVELDSGDIHPLQPASDGWYETERACPAGTRYRFIIDNRLQVPDPASRYQPEGVHGFSEVVDHSAWHWSTQAWHGRPWHEGIIYEAHVGLLDGFKGVAAQLPYLQQLGVTALQLMPLAESPGERNWGYDGVHPFAPQHSYGSPNDLKALIDAAHAHQLMIYLDVVYNHFGPDGNYLNSYASEFFREDVPTPWGAAIDFRRQEVRDFFIESALMWLHDYRVDGLRLDAVHAIYDKDFLHEFARRIRESVEPGRHVHLILENEQNTAELLDAGFEAQWNDDGHHVLHTILTGESDGYYADFAQDTSNKLARFLQDGFVFQGQRTSEGHSRGQPSAHLSPTAFVLFLQNHDQIGNRAFGERISTLANEDSLAAAVALVLLSPMIPMLFMGEERGSRQPFLYFTDHNPELARAVREGRRKEFSRFPRFSEDPRSIPDPNARETFLQSRPFLRTEADNDFIAWQKFYTRLLLIRRGRIIPGLHQVSADGATVLGANAVSARWTLAGGMRLRICVNLGTAEVALPELEREEEVVFLHRADTVHQLLPPGSILATLSKAGPP